MSTKKGLQTFFPFQNLCTYKFAVVLEEKPVNLQSKLIAAERPYETVSMDRDHFS